MLEGVAELRVAVPPEIENAKSETSKSPVPLDTAYTSSLNVMLIVMLSPASVREVIVGAL